MSRLLRSPTNREDILNDLHQMPPTNTLKKRLIPKLHQKEFVTLKEGNVIKVKVVKGDGLIPSDSNGLADPYVLIYVKEFSEISTSLIKKTLNPVWNEEFDFKITNSELSAIDVVFKVMDKDTVKKDDFMGQAVVYISKDDFPSMNTYKKFKLTLSGVDLGILHVVVGIFDA